MQFTFILSIIVAEWLAILVGELIVGRKDSDVVEEVVVVVIMVLAVIVTAVADLLWL